MWKDDCSCLCLRHISALFTGRNGINPRQAWVRTVRPDIRTRYLLDGKSTAYDHVATFRFDLLLQMWFDMWTARKIYTCFPSYCFTNSSSLHIQMMILNKYSVKAVDVCIFAFDPNLWFVVPKVAMGQDLPECRFFDSPALHAFTVMHLPRIQILQ